MTLNRFRSGFEKALEWVVIVLMVTLALEVTIGIVFRALGRSLAWYDEVAVILLAWLTFYGSALAAIKRAHIGFPGLVSALPSPWRLVATVAAKLVVLAFLALLGWIGYSILDVLATDYLISLPAVSVAWTQSVIPVSCGLFILAELLNLPGALSSARGRATVETSDIAEKLH